MVWSKVKARKEISPYDGLFYVGDSEIEMEYPVSKGNALSGRAKTWNGSAIGC